MAHTRNRSNYVLPPQHNPYRRLLAAIAYTAVTDYLFPASTLSDYDRATAEMFCKSPAGQQVFADLNISPRRVKNLLGDPS